MGDFNPKNGALCFLNAEQVGKILATHLFARFSLARAGNRL
jgi:hypothetical protein